MKQHPNNSTAPPPSHSEGRSFRDLHELAELLETLGLKLHAKNRIALGESGYYWHFAETLRKLGRLVNLPMELPAVDDEFGDAYSTESLAHDEQTRLFLSLLQSETSDGLSG